MVSRRNFQLNRHPRSAVTIHEKGLAFGMSRNGRLWRSYAAALILAISLTAASQAATNPSALANIRIGNFGQINENYFRGAQPEPGDYKDLATLGVKTVIDLTRDGRKDEQGFVE